MSAESAPNIDLRNSQSSILSFQELNCTCLPSKKPQKKTPQALIAQQYRQLDRYIELIEPKIQKIVEYNEAEVLLAYRNHFSKIKSQIERFKQETLAQVKNQANVLQKMEEMEKQLIVFREEAMRLFSIVTEKDKIIEELNMKLQEMVAEKKYMDVRIKQLMRANKEKQCRAFQNSENCHEGSEEIAKSFYNIGIHSLKKSILRDRKMKDRTLTNSNC